MNQNIIKDLVSKLQAVEPPAQDVGRAAVSVILKGDTDTSILLIKRAESSGDPWSGQIAFPGGKSKEGEARAQDTAIRETLEEVGIDLTKSAEFLGYSEPVRTHTGTMYVVPVVFRLTQDVKVKPNEEVASHRWVEIEKLVSPEAMTKYRLDFGSGTVEMPAFASNDYVVWGLTYRVLSSLTGNSKKP